MEDMLAISSRIGMDEILIRLLIDKLKIRSLLLLFVPLVLLSTVNDRYPDSVVHWTLYSLVIAHTHSSFAAKPQIMRRG